MKNIKKKLIQATNILKKQFDTIEEKQILDLVDLLQDHEETIFFTGIGKNGHVASITASTFASLGIKSYYLNPIEAVHGEIGNIDEKDIIILISKSGNTSELLNFVKKFSKNKKTKTILLSSNKESKISKIVDKSIIFDIKQEIDKHNMVPTISIVSYIMFLQSVGYHIAIKRGFNLSVFKKNHPGGFIGETLEEMKL